MDGTLVKNYNESYLVFRLKMFHLLFDCCFSSLALDVFGPANESLELNDTPRSASASSVPRRTGDLLFFLTSGSSGSAHSRYSVDFKCSVTVFAIVLSSLFFSPIISSSEGFAGGFRLGILPFCSKKKSAESNLELRFSSDAIDLFAITLDRLSLFFGVSFSSFLPDVLITSFVEDDDEPHPQNPKINIILLVSLRGHF